MAFNGEKIGIFYLSQEDINNNIELVKRLMGNCIVIETTQLRVNNIKKYKYTVICDYFKYVAYPSYYQDGCEIQEKDEFDFKIPEYEIKFKDDKIFCRIVSDNYFYIG